MKTTRKLKVGVSVVGPLVGKDNEKYSGFEIELWKKIANLLNLDYSFKQYNFQKLLTAVQNQEIDIGIGGITRTEKRENIINFSHLTLQSGLAILISKKNQISITKVFFNFFSKAYKYILIIFSLITIFVFLVANIVWLIEKGSGVFNTNYVNGILEASWWVIVTISTVGYGDFVPRTFFGRVIGVITIVLGFSLFGFFIAEITSLLTLTRLAFKINSPKDLSGKKVATKEKTTSVEELIKLNAHVIEVKEIEDSYKLLEGNEVEAVVFDAPVLQHLILDEKYEDFVLTGGIFAPQTYGYAFPIEKSGLRDKVNEKILELFESGEYDNLYKKWFGSSNFSTKSLQPLSASRK